MEMKLCPVCGKEYDDSQNQVCPYCGFDPSEPQETKEDDVNTPQGMSEDLTEKEDIPQQVVEIGEDTGDGEEKSNKSLKIVAGVLGAVLVILALVFAYIKFIAPKKSENHILGIIKSEVDNSIKNPEKFTLKDLDGTFSDKENHIYYTFTNEKASAKITPGGESSNDAEVDSAIDEQVGSSSEPEEKVETQTVEYDGTYTSGMTQKGIRQMVIINYIEENGLAQEYMDYVEQNNILSADFEGFIKEKGYEDDVDSYDSDKQMSKSLAFEKTQGYFNFEDGVVVLFDENGEVSGEYIITEKGLINGNYYYEGKMPSKGDLCAVYSMTAENYGMSQELAIRLYRDGYCVLAVEGDSSSYQAGTYKSDDKGIYVDINGQSIFFYVTDSGICNELLTK